MAIIPISMDHLAQSELINHEKNAAETKPIEKNDSQILNDLVEKDDNTVSTQWKVFQSVDEMSSALSQFNNRRAIENKKAGKDGIFSSFDSILEEDVLNKSGRILSSIRRNAGGLEYLLSFAKQMFPDASDLVLVLREIISQQELEKKEKKRCQEMLAKAEEENEEKLIKSGINCALKARLFAKSLDLSPKLLRTSYREFLFSENDPIDIYIKWISNFGVSRRKGVLEFIESSLLCDICAMDPSCSSSEFGCFLKKINQLQIIKNVESSFIKKMMKSGKEKEKEVDESEWVFFILNIIKEPRIIDSILVEVLGKNLFSRDNKELAEILGVVYASVKNIPLLIFKSEDSYDFLIRYLRHSIGKNLKLEITGLTK